MNLREYTRKNKVVFFKDEKGKSKRFKDKIRK